MWLGDRGVLVHAFQQRGHTCSVFFSMYLPIRVCYRTPDVVPALQQDLSGCLRGVCLLTQTGDLLPPTSPVVAMSVLSWSVSPLLFHK